MSQNNIGSVLCRLYITKEAEGTLLKQYVDERAYRGCRGDINQNTEKNKYDDGGDHPPFLIFPNVLHKLFPHIIFLQ